MMKFLKCFLFFLCVSVHVHSSELSNDSINDTKPQATPELIFASAIEISPRKIVTAYDLVEIREGTQELVTSLKAMTLREENGFVAKADLMTKLKGLQVRLMLPQQIKLIRSSQKVSRMELERKIKNQLLTRCSECEYQIQVQNVPKSLSADWELELNIDLNRETVMIPIRDTLDTRDTSSHSISNLNMVIAQISKYAEIPVLIRNAAANTPLDPSLFRLEKRVMRASSDLVMSMDELKDVQLIRPLGSGQAIQKKDLKKEQVIKKNQVVKAQAEKNGFQVFISAVAEDSGAVGDTIRVKNLDSQKVFAAEIIARGLVQID